jgi:hypothetical protein
LTLTMQSPSRRTGRTTPMHAIHRASTTAHSYGPLHPPRASTRFGASAWLVLVGVGADQLKSIALMHTVTSSRSFRQVTLWIGPMPLPPCPSCVAWHHRRASAIG